MRLAHLCDLHVRPDHFSVDRVREAFRRAMELGPDLVITGGDHIWDSLWADRETTLAQWDVYHRILREECRVPVEPVIGNHDVWGWGIDTDDPERGKPMALRQLRLAERYRAFDRGGWRFLILDSVYEAEDRAYTARLDEAQFAWLEAQLAQADRPVIVVSHIPIVSVTPYFFGENEASGDWQVPGPWMHLDARRLRDLLARYGVRLCIAGHMHQVDRAELLGVTYMVSGAVAGDLWNGPFEGHAPGFSVYDLHDDGSFTRTFHSLA